MRRDTPRASWDAMVRRVRRAGGTAIISHEILAPAQPEYVARLKRDLRPTPRSTSSTPPATWPARCRPAGRRASSRAGAGSTAATSPGSAAASRGSPARSTCPTVLSTWGNGLPPEQVHVVTVPQADARSPTDPDLLWQRFCRAFAIEPEWAPRGQRARQRLARQRRDPGAARAQRADRPDHPQQPRVRRPDPRHARRRDASAASSSRPILLPPKLHDWARERGEALGGVARAERGRRGRRPGRPAARAAGPRDEQFTAPRPGLAARPSCGPLSTRSRR